MKLNTISIDETLPGLEVYVATRTDEGSFIFTPIDSFIQECGCIIIAFDKEEAKKERLKPEPADERPLAAEPPKRRGRPPRIK